ncbi:MAG: malate dehydrogenase, partial [Bacteroidales bacterium]|nr:malate dehydrogenase [Candidatus Sodaliphilus fimicaballi]
AMPTTIDKDGVHFTAPEGTEEEMAALQASYEHLQKMREEIISLGIIPAVEEWGKYNPNL